ncbi:MAG TPA: GNAT family N-acetyltransferase [Micropruina sp.]|jgi:predicted GNAT family acetyltransferase|nr:GNAT family N-acetyltransferase [Micropruina sp.]
MAETVSHNQRRSRFEIVVDDELAGFAHYDLSNGVATFDHTEVKPAFNGRGLGTTLVAGALDQVRQHGIWKVRATCPFVVTFLRRHPEYADLVVP